MHVNLPRKYYFINKFDTNNIGKLDKNTGIILRNYTAKINLNLIISLKKFCKKKGYKFFLSNNVKLALNLNLDGAYIPSFNKKINFTSTFQCPPNFKIIGSAHNVKEIRIKKLQKCSEIFVSPIFQTKKKSHFLDITRFNNLTLLQKSKYIALGGINKKNYKKLKLTKVIGFASISEIKKNGLR